MSSWSLAVRAGLVCLVLLPGCARQVAAPDEDEDVEATRAALQTLAAPLNIEGFQVVEADGHRSVFLKLTRLPDSVSSYSESNPARVVVEIKGPTGQEMPEQFFPGKDRLVTYVRVSMSYGLIRVTLDLQAREPPPYAVLPMADWIMVRLGQGDAAVE